ncbi:MAG: 2-amino-4-hydroxy-6-hydroxymethyldihydropteridine diphosphokinase [Elusimicrobia bacterium GWF2_62_30]|nr:MAG: 2-amino-4-hydroxy-6-hydroxymethyldihydropteridine diphosphokinase [Elusimicrobia bacterium GWF2_62_30]
MRAFLALGSNLGDRAGNINKALELLSRSCRLLKVSSLYETPAMYYTKQGDFFNAVAEIETDLPARTLLRAAQAVEKELKRRRLFRNSPRTLDIDILFYGRETINSPALQVPHPKLAERPFVLAPLCEIAPDLRHPVSGRTAGEMLRACPGAAGARRLPGNYAETLHWLNSLPPSASFTTAPMKAALKALADPQDSLRAVHVAGTNGKGSVSAMIAGALTACGHKTGLYLSPHLSGPRERISLDGRQIPEEDFHRQFLAVKSFGVKLSYFEYLTAIALLWFKENDADFAVVEAGLGGRLDATNVFKRSLAVITNISLEHAAALGGSLKSIAAHKAGIIRPRGAVVTAASGPALTVIRRRTEAAGGKLYTAETDPRFSEKDGNIFFRTAAGPRPLRLALKGSFQLPNAALALKALEVLRDRGLKLPPAAAAAGLAAARLEGRFETCQDGGLELIFDGAHNPAALAALFQALRAAGYLRPVTLAAVMGDKDAAALVRLLAENSRELVFSGVNSPRARKPAELARIALPYGLPAHSRESSAAAFALARRLALKNGAPLLVTGSFYLAAEIKAAIKKEAPPVFPGELAPS